MIPDCSADLRWPIGRQAAPSSVNYQRPEAERGQQSIENTPPAGGWRGPSRRRGPQGRIIAPLSTTENWPFGRQRRWHLQLFDPDLSPTLAQRSCQHGAHGENRVRVELGYGESGEARTMGWEGSAEKGQRLRLGGGEQRPSTPSDCRRFWSVQMPVFSDRSALPALLG